MTPQQKAEKTYNFAADFFDHPALGFWDRCGRRTIELLDLQPGNRVLDICCGTGASALPAAMAVGSQGRVVGVDLAVNLLELGRRKAAAAGLDNIEFLKADMTQLPLGPDSFDAIVIVFGIFFIPDMEALVRKFWGLVRPGGTLAVTTWGPRLFEPAYAEWKATLATLAPEYLTDFNPWDRITTAEAVRKLMETNPAEVDITTEESLHTLSTPEDFWRVALGSGLRWPIEQMGEAKAKQLKEQLLQRMTNRPEGPVTAIETNAIYARARRFF